MCVATHALVLFVKHIVSEQKKNNFVDFLRIIVFFIIFINIPNIIKKLTGICYKFLIVKIYLTVLFIFHCL